MHGASAALFGSGLPLTGTPRWCEHRAKMEPRWAKIGAKKRLEADKMLETPIDTTDLGPGERERGSKPSPFGC